MSAYRLLVLLAAIVVSASGYPEMKPATPTESLDRRAPFSYIVTSDAGRYYYKMVHPDNDRASSGYAFKVMPTNSDSLLWTTSNWYSFITYLGPEGQNLVRINDQPSGQKPGPADLAIAFYDRGSLVNQYTTLDLVVDTSRITSSASSYQYLDYLSEPLDMHHFQFQLTTIDRMHYTFDIRTGDILTSEQLPVGIGDDQ